MVSVVPSAHAHRYSVPPSALRLLTAALLAGASVQAPFAQPAQPIRWAAVGASIAESSGYPAKLQALLGPAYKVENLGVSGTTLLKQGDKPYWTQGKLPQTFALKPQVVSIDLGGNDSKPQNWDAHKGEFAGDYEALLDTLGGISAKPLLIPMTPTPTFQRSGNWPFGMSNIVIRDGIAPLIRSIAKARALPLADNHAVLAGKDLTHDGVHPDPAKAGADSIAASLYRAYKARAIRVACIGNSITDNGHNANAYPVKLNQLLGPDYHVLNAGHSGRTLLRNGDHPYKNSPWFAEVFKFQPDIVTIKLGTNDTKPHNWDSKKGEFAGDLRWLVDTLSTIPTKPRIILCTPIPAWKNADGSIPFGIRGDVVLNEVIPRIKLVAQEKKLDLIDLHTPYLPYERLTPDKVHPNNEGLDTLARILHRAFVKAVPVALRDPGFAPGGASGRSEVGVSRALRWGAFEANPLAPLGVDAAGRRFEPLRK